MEEAEAVRDWVIVENLPTADMQQMTFVKDGCKLVLNEDAASAELYDQRTDPRQMKNLANHPDHQSLQTRMCQGYARADEERGGSVDVAIPGT